MGWNLVQIFRTIFTKLLYNLYRNLVKCIKKIYKNVCKICTNNLQNFYRICVKFVQKVFTNCTKILQKFTLVYPDFGIFIWAVKIKNFFWNFLIFLRINKFYGKLYKNFVPNIYKIRVQYVQNICTKLASSSNYLTL